ALRLFADIAGVKPAVFERALGFRVGVEVPARDVLAADENLAVFRDLHFHAGDWLADRSVLRAERMIQADDGRRLGEPVSLNDDEAELFPERFELRVERRRADDEGPELEAEQLVHAAVAPPAANEMFPRRARLKTFRHFVFQRDAFRRV